MYIHTYIHALTKLKPQKLEVNTLKLSKAPTKRNLKALLSLYSGSIKALIGLIGSIKAPRAANCEN
jgi:hypothetical protein